MPIRSFSLISSSNLQKVIHLRVFYHLISDKYKTLSIFDQTSNRKKSRTIKINPKSLKYSYLDWIQIKNKRKHPFVGKYNLLKTD